MKKLGERAKGKPLNQFTLSFYDKELNRLYTEDYVKKSLLFARTSLFLAIIMYMVFSVLDHYIMAPEATATILKFRISGVTLFIAAIFLTYSSKIAKYYQAMMFTVILVGGGNIVLMIISSEWGGGQFYYAGLILAVIYAHSLLRLRFIPAAISTWVIVGAYEISAIQSDITPGSILMNNSFFLIAANILGMFASYGIEYFMRMSFLGNLQMQEKSKQLEAEHERKSKELEDARQIQLSMIPKMIPDHPNYDISFTMKTASEVGGDFFDLIVSEDGTITFAVGDATGHGAKAGAMVTAMKFLFSNYAESEDIVEFLKRADHSLRQMRLPRLYMSFVIGRIKGNVIEAAGVGMPAITMFNCDAGKVSKLNLKGFPLGSHEPFPYKKHSTVISHHDVIMIMTDGLPELFNRSKETFGYDKVEKEFLKSVPLNSGEIIKNMSAAAENWLGDYPQNDDITLVIIKRKQIEERKECKNPLPGPFIEINPGIETEPAFNYQL